MNQEVCGVCVPKGFVASGVHGGLKKYKKDITVIYSEKKAVAAGVFTTNIVKAAPVIVDIEHLKKSNGKAQAIIANSAIANACTGKKGLDDAKNMALHGAKLLNLPPEEVLIASTGVIGVELPMEKLLKGITEAVNTMSKNGGLSAAEGIMTTDTVPKAYAVECEIAGQTVKIGGIAKGSGMIHPNMATMLCFITTDAKISQELLQKALKKVVDLTFNMISVDGDTSTNDMVLILANGEALNTPIEKEDENYEIFKKALFKLCKKLSYMLVEDGEGVTKVFEVQVKNARTYEDAKKAARKITESNLVKTAFFGEDANWGRIIASLGNSQAQFVPEKVDVYLENKKGREQMMESGMGLKFDEEKALSILQEKEITVVIDLNDGNFDATAWGCDLSYDYVKINAEYRS